MIKETISENNSKLKDQLLLEINKRFDGDSVIGWALATLYAEDDSTIEVALDTQISPLFDIEEENDFESFCAECVGDAIQEWIDEI